MPLLIQENYTAKLGAMLKNGDIDLILLSEPYSELGIVTQAVYDEPFRVVMPASHPWVKKPRIAAADLCNETLLLLSSGNCFRDQVLQTCAGARSKKGADSAGMQQSLEGSSLETIRQMVASGVGITVLPSTAAESRIADTKLTCMKSISGAEPSRRIALAWRKSFPRVGAVQAVRDALLACKLPGVTLLPQAKAIEH
jgi:LysR family hydrogen peroxide-inducible transcriptional activator